MMKIGKNDDSDLLLFSDGDVSLSEPFNLRCYFLISELPPLRIAVCLFAASSSLNGLAPKNTAPVLSKFMNKNNAVERDSKFYNKKNSFHFIFHSAELVTLRKCIISTVEAAKESTKLRVG